MKHLILPIIAASLFVLNSQAGVLESGQVVQSFDMRVQTPDYNGYGCSLELASDPSLDARVVAGRLTFGSFTNTEMGSTVSQHFKVSAETVERAKQLSVSLTPVNLEGRAYPAASVNAAHDIDYDFSVGRPGRGGIILSIYSRLQGKTAPTEPNKRMIRFMNSLCNQARLKFNQRYPQFAVESMTAETVKAENAW